MSHKISLKKRAAFLVECIQCHSKVHPHKISISKHCRNFERPTKYHKWCVSSPEMTAVSPFINNPTSNRALQPQHQTCTASRNRPIRVVHCSWNQYLYLRRNDDRSSCCSSVGGVSGVHFRANGYQERFMFLGYNNRTVRNKWILKLRPAMNKSANLDNE